MDKKFEKKFDKVETSIRDMDKKFDKKFEDTNQKIDEGFKNIYNLLLV